MVPMRQFVAEVGRVIGRRARMLPAAIDRGVCVAADRGFRIVTRSQMSPSLVRPAYFPQARARAVFGYSPQYRLRDGMAEMTREYRPAGA
jgi:nucleoside-diphosphate-sugar epimerase